MRRPLSAPYPWPSITFSVMVMFIYFISLPKMTYGLTKTDPLLSQPIGTLDPLLSQPIGTLRPSEQLSVKFS